MNMKTFIIWFLLLPAVVLAVTADTSVDNKKQGGKQVEIPTVEGGNDDKNSLNYEVDQKGWRGAGGRRGKWRGSGGRGGGWRGGGGRGGGWRGGGGREWRESGGRGWIGGDVELTTEQVNDDKGLGVAAWGWPGWRFRYGGWGWPGWRGGYGGWGWPGYGGWGWPGVW